MPLAHHLLSEPLPANISQIGLDWYAPHPALSNWVQCYWAVKCPQPIGSVLTENLYPDGGTTLVFDFSASSKPHVSFNAFFHINRIQFSGQVDKLGVRFHPGGAFQLMGLEMPLVMDRECLVEDFELQGFEMLQEQLEDTAKTLDRINLINNWFLRKAIKIHSRQDYIQSMLRLMKQPQLSVAEVMSHIPMSRRQLERKFQLEVGVAPARVKQLQRVKQARLMISRNPEISLVQVALETGFYDQAHFIRQFQKITGQTPGQYRQKKMSQKYNSK